MWTSLIGFMASGKTAVAQRLQAASGRPSVHVDARVEEEAGRSIAAIFSSEGEAAFRRRELAALQGLDPSGNLVVDTGGGVVETPDAMSLLQERGVVIWLDAPWDVLRERLQAGPSGQRPLVEALGWSGLEDLYHRRRRLYAAAADFRLPSASGGIPELARVAMLRSLMWQRRQEQFPEREALRHRERKA